MTSGQITEQKCFAYNAFQWENFLYIYFPVYFELLVSHKIHTPIYIPFIDSNPQHEKEFLEAISHLKRARIISQEFLNYLSIKLNNSEVKIPKYFPEIIGQISDLKK